MVEPESYVEAYILHHDFIHLTLPGTQAHWQHTMKTENGSGPSAQLARVRQSLENVKVLFDAAVMAIARQCSEHARLKNTLLDAYQASSYELAWACAEWQAAYHLCHGPDSGQALDQGLNLTYAMDAAQSILTRLERVYADVGMDPEPIAILAYSQAFQSLRRELCAAHQKAKLGAMAIDHPEKIGRVELHPDVAMIQDAFQRFAQDVVRPQATQIHRKDLTVPDDILSGMCSMGAFGLSIPENHGGSADGSPNDLPAMLAVTETLSDASLGAAGSLLTRPEILARALLEGGTQAQKDHWLPRMASGEVLCAIAITEPDHGSDVARLTLKAHRTPQGWLLNGAKTWCTFAGKAHLIMVVARTESQPGYQGLSLFLVDKPSFDGHEFMHRQPSGGRLSGRAIPTIGYRGMHSFDLHFEDYLVPDSQLIGAEKGRGRGFYYTMAGMTGGRMQTAARAAGVMHAALTEAIAYVKDRTLFGTPLASHQLTQVKICDMAALYAAARKLAYAVSHQLSTGGNPMQASLVKLLACRAAEHVTRDAQQLHGGLGYAEETAVSRHFVDARVLSIFEGAEETLALKVISRSLYESALSAADATHQPTTA